MPNNSDFGLAGNETSSGVAGSVSASAPLGPIEQHYADEVAQLEQSVADIKEEAKKSRTAVVFLLAISVVTLGIALWLHPKNGGWIVAGESVAWVLAALGWLLVIIGTAIYIGERSQQRELARELRGAQERAGLVAPKVGGDYFDRLVAINLTNLSDYYRLVRSHAGRSFTLAATASALGFALIFATLTFALLVNDAQFVGYVGAAAGTITEMVAAVFFVLYSRTVRQLKDYHDSLLQVQNVLLCLKMVESVADPERKADLTSAVLRSLLGKVASPVADSDDAPTSSPTASLRGSLN